MMTVKELKENLNQFPDSNKKSEIRDNMLVTIGARAGYMDSMNCISVGGSVHDEEMLAKFAVGVVDEYLATDNDMPFDEFIEKALTKRYGKANVCSQCENWKPHGLRHGRGVGDCKAHGTEEYYDTVACDCFK